MRRRHALVASLLVLSVAVGACAPVASSPGSSFPQEKRVEAVVQRDGDRWSVDYVLDREAPAWAFFNSALLRDSRRPWRPDWWSVETPGVVIERVGDYDVLRATDGGPVPRRVSIRMQPRPGDLEAAYDPALVFSDGAVALYSEQFDVIPLDSVAAARDLPRDLNGVAVPGGPARVTWRDRSGPVLFKGERRAEVTAVEAETYVLFGDAVTRQGDGVTTVVDPGLPRWLGEELAGFTPRVMGYYTRRLDPAPGEAPTLMVSWTGPTKSLSSMGGSVLPGMISMSFEGEGVLNPDADALNRAHWFIGHEGAHFWLGQAVRYEYARDMWITEGGADLMAVRALKTLNPAYDARAELQTEVDDCVRLTGGRSIVTAADRGEHRAYYACGAVFAMAAEGAQKARDGGDWFDFLRPLLDQPDGILTREEWLSSLTRVSRDPSLRLGMEQLLDQGATDPHAVIARLFDRTGVAFRMEGGRVVLL